MTRFVLTSLVAGLAALSCPGAAAAEQPVELERALLRKAPAVLEYLRKQGYGNVGVLKFLVTKDGTKLSDRAGTINIDVAHWLQNALILKNNRKDPLGVIDRASAVARKLTGASYLTREGRAKLFEATYPLGWGDQMVKADAFLTGVLGVSADNPGVLDVALVAFDRRSTRLEPFLEFQAAVRPALLEGLGESYVLRGAFGREGPPATVAQKEEKIHRLQDRAGQASTLVRAVPHPLQEKSAGLPVALTILYDGYEQPMRFVGNSAWVAEPREGQTVEFVLTRDGGRERYGVVLKVNGENTIRKQRQEALYCSRWILDPGDGPYTVKGYQLDNDTRETFRVLSVAESQGRELDYGPDVGLITMVVFREDDGPPLPESASDEEAQVAAVRKLANPSEATGSKRSFQAVASGLLNETELRGLIAEGEQAYSALTRVRFKAFPQPILTLQIRYYSASSRPGP